MGFTRLKQPNNWTCWPTVLAMITGKSVDDVIAFAGHDGGEEDSSGPLVAGVRRRAFWDQEAIIYLAAHGWTMGAWFDGNPATVGATTQAWGCWSQHCAVLVVKSHRFEGCTHVVLWDGEKVLDPNPEKPDACQLADYEIKQWWTLVNWGYDFFKNVRYEPSVACAS